MAVGNSFLKNNGKVVFICSVPSNLFCDEAGLRKAPEFVQEEIFKTILWRKNAEIIENLKGEGQENVGVNVGVNTILVLIENNPGINALSMRQHFNVSQRTIERWIKQLKKENKIEFKGAPKTGGYWKLISKEEQ